MFGRATQIIFKGHAPRSTRADRGGTTLFALLTLGLALGCGDEAKSSEGLVNGGPTSTDTEPATGSPRDASSAIHQGPDSGASPQSGGGDDLKTPTDTAIDSGVPLADAGAGGDAGVSSVCGGETPHGCYTLRAGGPEGCPARIPEIPTVYPFRIKEWDRCANRAVKAFAVCNYDGPDQQRGSCICDTGLHWICTYR